MIKTIFQVILIVFLADIIYPNDFVKLVKTNQTKKAIEWIEKAKISLNTDFKISLNKTEKLKFKVIHLAIYYNNFEFLEYLFLKDVNIEERIFVEGSDFNDLDYASPIHLAILQNNLKICEFLIQKGADLEAKNRWQDRPIHFAAIVNYQLAKLLVEQGVDLAAIDYLGNSPLHNACINGDWQTLSLFFHFQANINALNQDNESPLHIAALNNNFKAVKMLIKRGGNINAVNIFGESILHYAVAASNLKIIDLLISNGAEINAYSKEGKTPLDYSYENRFDDKKTIDKKLVERLINYGAVNGKRSTGKNN